MIHPILELTADQEPIFCELFADILVRPDGVRTDETMQMAVEHLGTESFLAMFHHDVKRGADSLRARIELTYPELFEVSGSSLAEKLQIVKSLYDQLEPFTRLVEAEQTVDMISVGQESVSMGAMGNNCGANWWEAAE